ncbi:jg27605 [Pararge aegeria aegeria]|uniref:Jg27605 protein n=1 Tax=Pararge aegeria aegeria TaxID=348720 RepID=A0A8S4QY45_9NEOP|nr:jg27605 [Pararge aegeria aegeria]
MIFPKCSNLEGNPDSLELGTEVEYGLGRTNGSGGGCASAEFVRVLPRGSIPVAKPLEPSIHGTVTRTLRALNPDQAKYSGGCPRRKRTSAMPVEAVQAPSTQVQPSTAISIAKLREPSSRTLRILNPDQATHLGKYFLKPLALQ